MADAVAEAPAPVPAAPPVPAAAPVAPAAPSPPVVAAPAPVATPLATPAVAEAAPTSPEPPAQPAAEPAPVAPAAEPEPASLLGEAGAKPPEAAVPEPAATPEAPAPAAAPVYEFKWQEGFTPLAAEELAPFTTVLGEAKVAPEAAQKLLDMHLAEIPKIIERVQKQSENLWNDTRKAWQDEIRADPELGGNRIQTVIQTCGQLINEYGGSAEQKQQLREVFNLTGAGDNPAVVRFIYNLGRALTEQSHPIAAPKPVPTQTRRADRRYAGTMTNGAA